MDEFFELIVAMRAALGSHILLSGGVIADEWSLVTPVRGMALSSSVKRRREFLCGRHHARYLLNQVTSVGVDIGRDESGCPVWPVGVVGSISHSSNFCIVALSGCSHIASVGIDTEVIGRVGVSLWSRIFSDLEIQYLRGIDNSHKRSVHAALIFSAKESLYKCEYSAGYCSYNFIDIEVDIDESCNRLRLFCSRQALLHKGYFAIGSTHVVTFILLDS